MSDLTHTLRRVHAMRLMHDHLGRILYQYSSFLYHVLLMTGCPCTASTDRNKAVAWRIVVRGTGIREKKKEGKKIMIRMKRRNDWIAVYSFCRQE